MNESLYKEITPSLLPLFFFFHPKQSHAHLRHLVIHNSTFQPLKPQPTLHSTFIMCCGPSSSSSQTSSKVKRRNVSPLSSTPYEKTTEGPAPVMYTAEKYEDLK